MDKEMVNALNEQINKELYSAYLYLAMAAYCDNSDFSGTAQWMKLQAKEEVSHAMKIYQYLIDCGEKVKLASIDAPEENFSSLIDVFEKTLAHEKKVTAMINKLYELALAKKDYKTQVMLHWFISEQVEEEKNASEILANLRRVENNPAALAMIDRKLGERS